MSNNKQSSIEWLAEQLKAKMQMWNSTKNYQEFHIVLEAGEFAKLIEQAKAMHKEEHGQTWDKSMENFEARGRNEMRECALTGSATCFPFHSGSNPPCLISHAAFPQLSHLEKY